MRPTWIEGKGRNHKESGDHASGSMIVLGLWRFVVNFQQQLMRLDIFEFQSRKVKQVPARDGEPVAVLSSPPTNAALFLIRGT
jgi:hypothetical protein